MTVDDFIMNPTGTMSVVLSRQIVLDTAIGATGSPTIVSQAAGS